MVKKIILGVIILLILMQIMVAQEIQVTEIDSEEPENEVMEGNVTMTGSTIFGEGEEISKKIAYRIGMVILLGLLVFIFLKIIKKRKQTTKQEFVH